MSKKEYNNRWDPLDFETYLEAYFSGEMKPEERREFFGWVESDKELKEEFEIERSLQVYTEINHHPEKYKDELDVMEAQKAIRESRAADSPDTSPKKWVIGTGAITILLTLGIFWATQSSDNHIPLPDLPTKKLYQPYPFKMAAKEGSAMAVGLEYYLSSDYVEARIHLTRALDGSTPKGIPQFLIATMDVYEKNEGIALETLIQIRGNPELSPMADAVNYFMAVASYNLGDRESALNYLDSLEKSDDPFVVERAKMIKKNLNILQ